MSTLNQNCMNAYRTKWNQCLLSENNDLTAANECFECSANALEIVGYYLVIYGSEAFSTWISNTKDIEKTDLHNKVEHLFKQVEKEKVKERSHTLS